MYFKIFGCAHEDKAILEFIRWWLRKGGGEWEKDITKNDNIKGFFFGRNVDNTVLVRREGKLDLIIEKDIIVDNKPRELKKGEMYLNKNSMNGFFRAIEETEKWLASRRDYDPKEIDEKKAYELGLRFDAVEIGFLLETVDQHGWVLHIRAEVVGIKK